MKKLLLCGLAFAISASAMAQQNRFSQQSSGKTLKQKAVSGIENVNATTSMPASAGPVKRNFTPTSTAVTLIPLGSSANAFGTTGGPRTALFAHPAINSVSFIHRATSSPGSGYLQYDYSTDGGSTWITNAGPAYTPTGGATPPFVNARYPQAMIYNPAGNTDPVNAKVSYFAPTLAGLNAGWGGQAYGVANLTATPAATKTEILSDSYLIADGMALNTNDNNSWVSDVWTEAGTGEYNDTLMLFKGVWNGTDYTYTEVKVAAPQAGATPVDKVVSATQIAWAPNGLIGYAAILGHESFSDAPDSSLYPTIFKTTDAGATWNRVASLGLNAIDTILQSGLAITTGFEMDMAVDANGNCHLVMEVGPLGSSGFSIVSQSGFFGIFDLYTTDGGTNWNAQLLALPQTFRGEFVDASTLAEDNRCQVARTLDGTRLFFVWFDTDTLTFGVTENINPDAHCVGYNVTTNQWTQDINLTAGTDADGVCIFGNVSPFTLASATAGCHKIPMGTLTLTGGGPSSLTDHQYIDGAEVCDADFTVTGAPQAITNFAVSVQEIPATASFAVGQNYPNPFRGETRLDINVKNNSDVTVEVFNILGKLVSTSRYSNLTPGVNTLTIDASNLSAGMYTYSVTIGTEKVSRNMMVK
jgi:hypothetical protein